MALTRQEKEKLVLDLYYNQNKSYHQIAKEARICPRDIKAILEKTVKAMELKESMFVSSLYHPKLTNYFPNIELWHK
jgi:predicted DNA-binding protein YlxM (UPF0122 family)